MRLPRVNETKVFFLSIGYRVEQIENANSTYKWMLYEPDAVSGLMFDSLVDLWAQWLHYAAFLLSEDDKLQLFLTRYERATERERELMREAVSGFHGAHADRSLLRAYVSPMPPPSPDSLPEDWVSRVRKVLGSPGGNTHFPERARLALLSQGPL